MNFGNLMSVPTSGASAGTARQDGLGVSGVSASHQMAQTDAGRMSQYKADIKACGRQYGVEPAVIAGIISRESRAGNTLQNGWGDRGNAWGLMQVDVNPRGGGHTARGGWNSREHICRGTEILVDSIKRVQNNHPNWTKEQQLKGGIAAYNMGSGNVRTVERMDVGSTGGDYSSDVVARAQWFKGNGY